MLCMYISAISMLFKIYKIIIILYKISQKEMEQQIFVLKESHRKRDLPFTQHSHRIFLTSSRKFGYRHNRKPRP